jgi:hypothetical protein
MLGTGFVKRRAVSLYKRAHRWRENVLTRIEYVQKESARWRLAFNTIKLPYNLLTLAGFSPRMAGTLIFAGVTVGGGVVANETVLSGYSFERGDPGIYLAPADSPIEYSSDNQTLRVDLGSTPVGEIIIEDVSIGTSYTGSTIPQAVTEVIVVGGVSTVSTYLEVGHLVIDRWRCSKLTFSNIEVYELNVKWNSSDGQSVAAVPGVPRPRAIGGGNRADSMTSSGGYYDLIKIRAPTSGKNGQVDYMRLSNIYSKGGNCLVDRLKVGTLDIIYNEIGNGDGFDDKDFIIEDSVIYKTFNSVDNYEVSISPPS